MFFRAIFLLPFLAISACSINYYELPDSNNSRRQPPKATTANQQQQQYNNGYNQNYQQYNNNYQQPQYGYQNPYAPPAGPQEQAPPSSFGETDRRMVSGTYCPTHFSPFGSATSGANYMVYMRKAMEIAINNAVRNGIQANTLTNASIKVSGQCYVVTGIPAYVPGISNPNYIK